MLPQQTIVIKDRLFLYVADVRRLTGATVKTAQKDIQEIYDSQSIRRTGKREPLKVSIELYCHERGLSLRNVLETLGINYEIKSSK